MPWKDTSPMNERIKFLACYLSGESTMTDLCNAFGISRKTGYKWIERYNVDGPGSTDTVVRIIPRSDPRN